VFGLVPGVFVVILTREAAEGYFGRVATKRFFSHAAPKSLGRHRNACESMSF
jgi:hypothetical protein